MEATNFTRDDCQVGNRRRTYNALRREWKCNECGGRLVLRAPNEQVTEWHVECGRCGSCDFIHEVELERQACEAREVVAGLPEDLRRLLGVEEESRKEMAPEETLEYGRSVLRHEIIEI